jgi:penicillin-binding protein 2
VRGTLPVDPAVLAYVRDALAGVTTEGTAAGAFAGLPLAVAGKTGTAEVAGKQDTSWFASYAPADDPQLVVVGMVSQGGTGGKVAAPLVREVYEGIYGLGGRPAALPGGQLPLVLPELPARVRP